MKPDKWTTLRRGEDITVRGDDGKERPLRICVVPGRLAIELLMAAGNEDPQTVVALAAGVPVADLDWIATDELPRLQELALELNFEGCAAMAETRAAGATRMLPVLRSMGKKAIEQAMDALVNEWETSLGSKISSLRSTIEQALSSDSTQASSSKPNPSPESASDYGTLRSGASSKPV